MSGIRIQGGSSAKVKKPYYLTAAYNLLYGLLITAISGSLTRQSKEEVERKEEEANCID